MRVAGRRRRGFPSPCSLPPPLPSVAAGSGSKPQAAPGPAGGGGRVCLRGRSELRVDFLFSQTERQLLLMLPVLPRLTFLCCSDAAVRGDVTAREALGLQGRRLPP